MIEVKGLSKYYAGVAAIDHIDFQIAQGEIVGLLGLNGAGKSTILKILGCFLMPSTGKAFIDGFSIEQDSDVIRAVIGYLPDSPPLYDEMTVSKYLRFVARLKNVMSGQVENQVQSAIAKTNLNEVAEAPLGQLSHGFRQRVGIAQAIVHNPKVLILDEPINGLDPIQIVEMRDLILSFRGQHTVILSSHILSEITKTCDRILIVDRGKLIAEGTEKDIQQNLSRSMKLKCEVDELSDGLLVALKKINGVKAVNVGQKTGFSTFISIETMEDTRAQIAQTIVQSGCGLLSLSRDEQGLESVFVKLIQNAMN